MVGEKVADIEANYEARKAICLQLLTDLQGRYIEAIGKIADTPLDSIDKLALQQEALKIGEVANLVLHTKLEDDLY